MPILTTRTSASGAALTDLIHIVKTGDTSQNSAGSSYKIEMGDYVELFGGAQNNFVRQLIISKYDLPDPFTEQDICNYILALPEAERTILETDSKWNVLIINFIS